MQETKIKIKQIVDDYIRLFPEEYAIVCKAVRMKKEMTHDQYASVDGMFEGRALYEISETLNGMLMHWLNDDDIAWLKAGGVNKKQGARWFAKTFPMFALPDQI